MRVGVRSTRSIPRISTFGSSPYRTLISFLSRKFPDVFHLSASLSSLSLFSIPSWFFFHTLRQSNRRSEHGYLYIQHLVYTSRPIEISPHMSSGTMSRSFTGCKRCKARRQKCDEQRPACGRCKTAGIQCRYAMQLQWGGRAFSRSRFGACMGNGGMQKLGKYTMAVLPV